MPGFVVASNANTRPSREWSFLKRMPNGVTPSSVVRVSRTIGGRATSSPARLSSAVVEWFESSSVRLPFTWDSPGASPTASSLLLCSGRPGMWWWSGIIPPATAATRVGLRRCKSSDSSDLWGCEAEDTAVTLFSIRVDVILKSGGIIPRRTLSCSG